MGQREQPILVQPDQRALQQGGEVEVVLGQQREAAERRQVHDGDLLRQHHPVDAGHRHAGILEGAHHLGGKGGAPAQQHHDVARADRPRRALLTLSRLQQRAVVEPAAHHARDAPRQPGRGRDGEALVDGRAPGGLFLGFLGGQQRPDLDPARGPAALHLMLDHRRVAAVGVGQPVLGRCRREHGVDRGQHGRGRAEGDVELDRPPGRVGALGARLEMLAHLAEGVGVGTLEAVDRLLHVADREQRALGVAGAAAGIELLRQGGDHGPLVGAGVLGLVDQHMVDAAIQLVEDPGRDPRQVEERTRAQDQVLVVEHGARRLGQLVAGEDRLAEAQQCGGRGAHGGRPGPVLQVDQACRFVAQGRLRLGVGGGRALVDEAGEHRAGLGQEGPAIAGDAARARIRRIEPFLDQAGALGLLVGARGQRPHRLAQSRFVEGRRPAAFRQHRRLRRRLRHAQHRRDPRQQPVQPARLVDHAGQPPAPPQQVAQQVEEGILADMARHFGDGGRQPGIVAGCGQRLLEDAGQQLARSRLVGDREMRRHSGLDREAGEERLAEGVDGLDAHPARRVEDAGEEASGGVAAGLARNGTFQPDQVFAQRRLVGGRPVAQDLVQPVRHLGRGRLGEGQAQQPLGCGPRQQQAQDAVGQDGGLAGAGRCADPGGCGRVGGGALRDRGQLAGQGVGDHAGAGHSPPSAAPSDHSDTRARWA